MNERKTVADLIREVELHRKMARQDRQRQRDHPVVSQPTSLWMQYLQEEQRRKRQAARSRKHRKGRKRRLRIVYGRNEAKG